MALNTPIHVTDFIILFLSGVRLFRIFPDFRIFVENFRIFCETYSIFPEDFLVLKLFLSFQNDLCNLKPSYSNKSISQFWITPYGSNVLWMFCGFFIFLKSHPWFTNYVPLEKQFCNAGTSINPWQICPQHGKLIEPWFMMVVVIEWKYYLHR